eukprot:TRINITY_DN22684_c0_g1_i1.p1 TRINITY_DN22684_c0_g1~~TRINITY_DN22684_c0_g1_i1.p1  ORF type:complete len:281 (+),score=31.94 TRINITY_DN22684_c0_g1_i1:311-1153(+)
MSSASVVKVVTLSGHELRIEAESACTVGALKDDVANTLNMSPLQCVLLHAGIELEDDSALIFQQRDACGEVTVHVAVQPCFIRSWDYHKFVVCGDQVLKGFARGDACSFPEPKGINVDKIRFCVGDIFSLPDEVQHYWTLIKECALSEHRCKVGYLTVQEGFVNAGDLHGQPGIHIEVPDRWGSHDLDAPQELAPIYMATTMPNTYRFWNCHIREPARAAGSCGEVEHLTDFMGDGELMAENTLYHLTDVTPYEAIAAASDVYRQYFRVSLGHTGPAPRT